MLVELRVRDYAVIEDLTLEPGSGLTALSGETGAGKSIVVGALSLLIGGRASADVVRTGSRRASIEAVFDVTGHPELKTRIEKGGYGGEDGLLILRREVATEGRNRAWVNGSPATAGTVGELGAAMVDIHGQHEHQSLARSDARLALLDAFAGSTESASRVAELASARDRAAQAVASLESNLDQIAERADFLRFRLGEIENVAPKPDEDTELNSTARRLEHSEELSRGGAEAHLTLYEGEGSIYERVREVRLILDRMATFDRELADSAERLAEAEITIEELGRSLGDYASGVDHDPGQLAAVRDRLDELQRLKRRYGPELGDVLEVAARCRAELARLDDPEGDLGARRKTLVSLEADLAQAAARLTKRRSEASKRLEREVEAILPELGLPGARFVVALRPHGEIKADGAESVEFLVSPNPGFEPMRLGRVASGGELSRIMLALKSVLATADRTPVLVFDEVDAGVGGTVAVDLGTKLAELARSHQVLVVTHLAQVASRASAHFVVEKRTGAALTSASVRELSGSERVEELARMMGGDPDSTASLEHARELLGSAGKGG